MGGQLIQPYSNTGAGNTLINPYLPASQTAFQFWIKPVYTASDGTLWCPGFEGPTYLSNPWDYIDLGVPLTNTKTPGKCRVRTKKGRRLDKKQPVGSDGTRHTFYGVESADVDIEIEVWTPDQLRALGTLWPILFPAAYKGAPPNYTAYHPVFAKEFNSVLSLQFVSGEGPEISGRTGIFRIRAVEHLKPSTKKAVSTSVGAAPSLFDPPPSSTPGSNSANLGP